MRNVVLGDYFIEAWAYNIEHLPLTKWVLALGDLLGGLNGARIFAGRRERRGGVVSLRLRLRRVRPPGRR